MRILLVTSRHPWPSRRGDQVRAAQMLDLLTSEHEVTLLAPAIASGSATGTRRASTGERAGPPAGCRIELYDPSPLPFAVPAGLARALPRGLPIQSGLFYRPDLRRRLRTLSPRVDLVVIQLARLALHLGDAGDTPVAVDLIDSLALNCATRATVDRPALRPALLLEARLLARAERLVTEAASRVVLVCERDRRALASRLPELLTGRLDVVGLAVPPSRAGLGMSAGPAPRAGLPAGSGLPPGAGLAAGASLAPGAALPPGAGLPEDTGLPPGDGLPAGRGGTGGPVLAFTGNLGYFVNHDAVAWWVRGVWPRLRRARPDLRLVVAGDRPGHSLVRLLAGAGAELVASPADLGAVLACANLALAPLRCGSGVPIKVLQAWSAGVPVVASPWAAAGTTGRAGEDLAVASDVEQWVTTVLDLLESPDERRRLAENGRRRLTADYSPEVVKAQWQAALGLTSRLS